MANLIGKSLDRYHILEQLGEGGMATVYKAYDTRLERDVAIKIIRIDAFPPNQLERILKRFEREAKALGRLSHPNIIKVIDYGEHEGSPFLVMEYLAGGTLKQRLGRPIPWQDTVRFLLPIAEALEYAHEQKIIHRDIKPSNILLTQKGQPMLTDFGIAKILEADQTFTLTGTGIGVGTPEYMSPEQWTGQATAQSDIYSLGVVLYEMVTGRKPYTADTPAAILLKQATEPLPRPSKYVSNLPDSIEKILLKALASNSKVRYQNIGALIEGLENLLMGIGKSSKPVATPILSKPVESDTDTQDTYLQKETSSTRLRTASYDKTRGKTLTTQTMNLPVTQKKKFVWWPWAVGIGGMVCLVLIGVISIGGGLLAGNYIPAATEIPFATQAPVVIKIPAVTDTAVVTQIPATRIPATPTRVPTATLSMPSCSLESCDTSSEDICVFGISPQPTDLIISFKFKQELNPSNLPQLLVGGQKFVCDLLVGYPGRLFCNGATVVGRSELVLVSSTNAPICSGTFNIPKYVEPLPTKKKPGNDNYP